MKRVGVIYCFSRMFNSQLMEKLSLIQSSVKSEESSVYEASSTTLCGNGPTSCQNQW